MRTSKSVMSSIANSSSTSVGQRQVYSGKKLDKDIRQYLTFYGTAWKKEATHGHVLNALKNGFRGIDTATQPRHYYQPGVGDAVEEAVKSGVVASRDDLWLQTKFTSISGQDPNNVPYNPRDALEKQVADSFAVSLSQLKTDYVDSLVLHGLLATYEKTMEVWGAMEKLVDAKQVQLLGISNCYDLEYFKRLYADAKIKPAILQNRFYEESGWDHELRSFCRSHNILYQSFWTLTANPAVLKHALVRGFAKKYSSTPEGILYRYVVERGGMPLNGTTSVKHMQEDLALIRKPLDPKDVEAINSLLGDTFPL